MRNIALLALLSGLLQFGCGSSSPSTMDDVSTISDEIQTLDQLQGDEADALPVCEVACQGLECGEVDDGQGGVCACGTCSEGLQCNLKTNRCECTPTCGDNECGEDGCGGTCGHCLHGECVSGQCQCTPDCEGKECGFDGCGGSCGQCGYFEECWDGKICSEECNPTNGNPFVGDFVQKVSQLDIGSGGHPGEALDVDNNPETCAPDGDCEGGLDNQLSEFLGQLAAYADPSEELENALVSGDIVLLAETYGWTNDGSEFTIKFYWGEPANSLEECDIQTEKCDYLVDPYSYNPYACDVNVLFENARFDGTTLTAGGPNYLFSVAIPIAADTMVYVTAYMAQLQATVTGEGDTMTWTDGVIGGAVPKQKFLDAVDQLSQEAVDGLPVSIEMLRNLLEMFIDNDVDTDEDGEMDAASIGIKFSTIAGSIVGFSEYEE